MSTEVAIPGNSDLAIGEGQTAWTPKQLDTLKALGVKDATQGDLDIFFYQAARTGLDPFLKQIYMLGRWTKDGVKQTIQTGIDGFRLIARRAADKAGETLSYSDTLWASPDGVWREFWQGKVPPVAAKVTVYRNGSAFPAVATYAEYVQTFKDGNPNPMWGKMPANQLAKCAEALALRKAFPQDLSGIYTDDEMGQADNDETPAAKAAPATRKPVTISEAMNRTQSEPTPEPEDLGEILDHDFLADAKGTADVDEIRAIWIDAQAAGAPAEVLASIQALAMATPADEAPAAS